jgi:MFS family permease
VRSLVPLYTGEFLIFVANSIAFTAIAARAVEAGLDSATIGSAGSAFYAGLFAAYAAGPVLVRRMGLRGMTLSAVPITLAGLAALLLALPAAWLAGRFAMGVGIAVLVVAIENWINLSVGRNALGRALAFYMAVYLASYVTGQSALLIVSPSSDLALWIAGASLILGLAALALAHPPKAPPPAPLPRGGAGTILRHAGTGVAACLVSGLAAGAFYALGPAYALTIGMTAEQVPTFMIAVMTGAGVAQVALGVASDRFERHVLLAGIYGVAGLASLALLLVSDAFLGVFVVAMVWGATAPIGYATAAAIAYDAPHGRPVREVAQVVLVANGIGGILGPALASGFDLLAPGKGLFIACLAVFAVLVPALLVARSPVERR